MLFSRPKTTESYLGNFLLLESDGLLDGDLAEVVHRVFDVVLDDAGAIGLDANLHRPVNYALHSDQNLHFSKNDKNQLFPLKNLRSLFDGQNFEVFLTKKFQKKFSKIL